MTASSRKKLFKNSIVRCRWPPNVPPPFASPTLKYKPFGAPSCCSNFFPTVFPTAIFAKHFAALLGQQPESLSPGRMSYHLRRLRLHGIIERIPQTHRYRITNPGLRTVWFCTRTYSRILRPGLGTLLPDLSPPNSSLRRCFDRLDQEITSWIEHTKLAA
jgi:hypothetical protein